MIDFVLEIHEAVTSSCVLVKIVEWRIHVPNLIILNLLWKIIIIALSFKSDSQLMTSQETVLLINA